VLKSVPSSEYNREYFQGRYQNLSEEMLKDISRFERSHQKASSMIELGEDDTVVDLGCGTGQMPIFLYLKFSCNVIGIDYSEDAIRICEENKESFFSLNTSVISHNSSFPKLGTIVFIIFILK